MAADRPHKHIHSGGTGMIKRFEDRHTAGRELAAACIKYSDDALVLALPRGGVPVGYEISMELDLPLDVFMVRKLRTPKEEDLALGAVASGDVTFLNREIIEKRNIPEQEINERLIRERLELDKAAKHYRGNRPRLPVRGRTVILTDDGIASGSSMEAALIALDALEPARTVVAVPVAEKRVYHALKDKADDMICLITPSPLMSVGSWYRDFRRITDENVRDYIRMSQEAYASQRRKTSIQD